MAIAYWMVYAEIHGLTTAPSAPATPRTGSRPAGTRRAQVQASGIEVARDGTRFKRVSADALMDIVMSPFG